MPLMRRRRSSFLFVLRRPLLTVPSYCDGRVAFAVVAAIRHHRDVDAVGRVDGIENER